MKKIIRLTESDLTKIVKRVIRESNKMILSEDWFQIAKKALGWVSKNEDEIATLFKTTEKALLQSMDELVEAAIKSKSISQLDDMQMKLMHFYNPSGLAENVGKAQQQMKNFLNGYSKSKGKMKWSEFRDEVQGVSPKPKSQAQPNPDNVQVRQKPVGGTFTNKFSTNRISNRSFSPEYSWLNDIDASKIKNWGKGIDDYNKTIAKAIETGDYQYISSGGFEKFGIDNFRDFLKNNIKTVNEVNPLTGRWSVTFK